MADFSNLKDDPAVRLVIVQGLLQRVLEGSQLVEAQLRAEVERLTAEVEMLRGVGCMEDGDGPCGVCRKCAYRRGVAAMREAEALLTEVRRVLSAHCWSGECCTMRARIDDALANKVTLEKVLAMKEMP